MRYLKEYSVFEDLPDHAFDNGDIEKLIRTMYEDDQIPHMTEEAEDGLYVKYADNYVRIEFEYNYNLPIIINLSMFHKLGTTNVDVRLSATGIGEQELLHEQEYKDVYDDEAFIILLETLFIEADTLARQLMADLE